MRDTWPVYRGAVPTLPDDIWKMISEHSSVLRPRVSCFALRVTVKRKSVFNERDFQVTVEDVLPHASRPDAGSSAGHAALGADETGLTSFNAHGVYYAPKAVAQEKLISLLSKNKEVKMDSDGGDDEEPRFMLSQIPSGILQLHWNYVNYISETGVIPYDTFEAFAPDALRTFRRIVQGAVSNLQVHADGLDYEIIPESITARTIDEGILGEWYSETFLICENRRDYIPVNKSFLPGLN